MKYLIGVDLGTSGTKTVLFSQKGEAIASCTIEYPMYQPKNGWAEQDPEDWYNAAVNTIKNVLEQSGVPAEDVAGIGFSGQMHGLVMLDSAGNVLRKSILWCDGRTIKECEEITQTIGKERLIEITANPALPGFTAGKILWVRKHEPEIWQKCAHILLPKDYIRYRLTGDFATDVSDASGMGLMDIANRCWSNEVLEKLSIPKSMLAKLYESSEITGYISAQAAMVTGLKAGTVVVGGAGDNAAAAVGTGVVEQGKAFTTIGTSGVVFAHTDKPSIDQGGRVHTFCSAVPNSWTAMSCTLAAGLSLQWFRNNFCFPEMITARDMDVDPYYIMDKQSELSPIGANRLVYLPYLMGERSPILDSNARGAFIGLSAIHTKRDLIRAVMEGVIYSQKHCLEILRDMDVVSSEMIACGGGGTSPVWRQMMADIYNLPVKTVINREGPALGAAILAGVGAGLYKDVPSACREIIKTAKTQDPISDNVEKYTPFYNIYKSLYPALKESFAALANIVE